MMGAMPNAPWRWSAVLWFSLFAASGCGSAAVGQRATTSSTVSTTATAAVAARSTSRSQQRSGRAGERSGVIGQSISSGCAISGAGDRPCPRHPVRATIVVLSVPSRHQVAMLHTDRAGRFQLNLRPGSYAFAARTSNFLLFAPTIEIRVLPQHLERLTVTFFMRHPLPVTPAREAVFTRTLRPTIGLPLTRLPASGGCDHCDGISRR